MIIAAISRYPKIKSTKLSCIILWEAHPRRRCVQPTRVSHLVGSPSQKALRAAYSSVSPCGKPIPEGAACSLLERLTSWEAHPRRRCVQPTRASHLAGSPSQKALRAAYSSVSPCGKPIPEGAACSLLERLTLWEAHPRRRCMQPTRAAHLAGSPSRWRCGRVGRGGTGYSSSGPPADSGRSAPRSAAPRRYSRSPRCLRWENARRHGNTPGGTTDLVRFFIEIIIMVQVYYNVKVIEVILVSSGKNLDGNTCISMWLYIAGNIIVYTRTCTCRDGIAIHKVNSR